MFTPAPQGPGRRSRRRDWVRGLSRATAALLVLFEFTVRGQAHPWRELVAMLLAASVVAAFGGELVRDTWAFRLRLWRHRWPDLLFAVPVVLSLGTGNPRGAAALVVLRLLAREIIDAVAWRPARPMLEALQRRPLTMLVLSVLFTVLMGTLALMFPAATRDGQGAPFMVALFTATSAACVTGLTVVDTGSYFSGFGHWVILSLVQVGGLGIMTITTTLALAFRSQLSARTRGAMQEMLDEETVHGFQRLLYSMMLITVTLEALGALALYPSFRLAPDGRVLEASERAFYAAFHSVAAFCNAGFGLYPDNMMRFVGHPTVNLTLMALVVLGGLGFPVVTSLLDWKLWRSRGVRGAWRFLPVHTRVALIASAGLVVGGAVSWLVLEWNHSLAGLSFGERLLASLFQSVSLRSAGFNSVDIARLGTPMMLISLMLMFIGGSPGGTAGGVKTTTVAVLVFTFRALLRNRSDVELMGRSVPVATVYRACAVTLICVGLLFGLAFLLFAVEPHLPFREVLFEAVSAFGTTGLTTGVTPQLSTAGKLVVCAQMFVGRLGPFTLALAVGLSKGLSSYSFPSTKIVVG
ncbi:TrkH family potassium uptake protein [Hyalangium rubrum]|uniref:Potassium transporter TrkG n=1 Tax=Hyalangium rubrum TaxID=3103134 RepID=A0ABU5GWK6_9BACT|nr:potassium transporter TrkG [Hyalangium sp. s54d21]MDY7225476.1 potassium transporter TrkG [Hyalangium sp. s54d21]